MSSSKRVDTPSLVNDSPVPTGARRGRRAAPQPKRGAAASRLAGWNAALSELQHQAGHLEARGAVRAAVTLYDAIRIARAGGLACEEHRAG